MRRSSAARRKGSLHLNGGGHLGAPSTTLRDATLTTLSPFKTVAVLLTLLRARWPQFSRVCSHHGDVWKAAFHTCHAS